MINATIGFYCAKIRITEVLPIFNFRAITALGRPSLYSRRIFSLCLSAVCGRPCGCPFSMESAIPAFMRLRRTSFSFEDRIDNKSTNSLAFAVFKLKDSAMEMNDTPKSFKSENDCTSSESELAHWSIFHTTTASMRLAWASSIILFRSVVPDTVLIIVCDFESYLVNFADWSPIIALMFHPFYT